MLLYDIRHAIRRLAKTPGFVLVAVLTLSMGMATAVSIFGIVDSLLFKPRAVSQPDQLAAVGFRLSNGALAMMNISRPFYEVFRREQRSFSDLIGFAELRLSLQRGDQRRRVRAELVSGSYFRTLGVEAHLGRTLLTDDDAIPGQGAVAVISHAFWQRHLDGDPNVIGQTLRLENYPIEIVGVAGEAFRGLDDGSADLWLPTTLEPVFDKHTVYRLVGRLAPGVSRRQAQADLQGVVRFLSEAYTDAAPPGYERYGQFGSETQIALLSAGRGSVGPFFSKKVIQRAFYFFMGASGLVLLIGCANFANLLLLRMLKRRKEIATQLALGARPYRIVRTSLIESLLLAGLGGLLAVILAMALNPLLVLWKPANVQFMAKVSMDWRIFLFAFLTALGTGVLCGLAPAFQCLRFDLFPALKGEAILAGGGRRGLSLRHWMAASQLAITLVLLLGAGLCLMSFGKLLGLDPGFDTTRTIVAEVNLRRAGYSQDNAPQALLQIIERVQSLSDVSHVTFSWDYPLRGGGSSYGVPELAGYDPKPGEQIQFTVSQIGPDFFHTVGVPLIQGNELSIRDFGSDQRKVLINESFRRRYWPGQDVLGRHILRDEVIGVVADSRLFDLTEDPIPLVFRQESNLGSQASTHLLIRTEGNAEATLSSVVAVLNADNPKLLGRVPRTMRALVLRSLGPQGFTLALIAGFAVMALILASVGVYGLMAYMASLMTKEVGIRLSLGAQKRDIVHLVLRFGLKIIALGILLGIPCAAIATGFIRSELYDVHPLHPLVFGIAVGILGIVALIACWLPARRAAKVDPMAALRYE